MSLPKNPYKEYAGTTKVGGEKFEVCAARDKEWVDWLLDRWIENTDSGIQAIWIEPDDFEALKKLAQGEIK